jgi:hypothetical protein
MVSGTVAPARLDLGNADLVEAHVHSVWLAAAGLDLRRSMADVLDLGQPGYPLHPDIQERSHLPEQRIATVRDICRRLLEACGEQVSSAPWYTEDWLDRVLQEAAMEFDHAFDRWRELYESAVRQRDEARRIIDDHRAGRQERSDAERREREAKRQLSLLLNESEVYSESDFYPYRYLAAEGFIPGYNFPRLPIRALLPYEDTEHNVDRPRFLAIGEFGPRNLLYHEGRKYRVDRCLLPLGSIDQRLTVAKLCQECGYFHEGAEAQADRCDHCGTELDADHSEYIRTLFEMSTVYGKRVERITCDEEERVRQGFYITTQYRFAQGPDGLPLILHAAVKGENDAELMRLSYASQATLWRVNHRWRTSRDSGFAMDSKTGYWVRRPGEGGHQGDVRGHEITTGVRPFVRDTRNILLLSPRQPCLRDDEECSEAFLAALGYALQRGVQQLYQIEEREIVAERIGRGKQRQLLFWEAAEGGTGVWPRLMEDPRALAHVAAEALRVCHFEVETGGDVPDACSRACYRCLLSYVNQLDHPILDRHIVKDYLMTLTRGVTMQHAASRSYEEQYHWLLEQVDQASELERRFLDHLFMRRHRLPDRAQYRPEADVFAEADFFYERSGVPGAAVFCDGPGHDLPARKSHDQAERGKLENLGYRVIAMRYDRDIAAQVAEHPDVFGPGRA